MTEYRQLYHGSQPMRRLHFLNKGDNMALFNGFLWHTGDYDSREIIMTRGAAEGDNDFCENQNPQYAIERHLIKQLSLEGNLFPFNCAT